MSLGLLTIVKVRSFLCIAQHAILLSLGYHNRLKTKVGHSHPNFFKFIQVLREVGTENRNSGIRANARRGIAKPLDDFSRKYREAVEAFKDSEDDIIT